jgi:hypothetical protein
MTSRLATLPKMSGWCASTSNRRCWIALANALDAGGDRAPPSRDLPGDSFVSQGITRTLTVPSGPTASVSMPLLSR